MTEKVSRVIVLGHEGFIGTRVFAAFAERSPDVELVGRSLPDLDLTDADSAFGIGTLLGGSAALVVLSGIKRQFGDSLDIFEKNMAMAVNLCRVIGEHPVGRIVYFSSAAVYGEDIDDEAISEATPVAPSSNYGIAKYASERLLEKAVHAGGGSLTVLRPPVVYGPGDVTRTYGPAGFAHAAATGQKVVLWGDGSERREFVFVDDVAEVVRGLTFTDHDGAVNVVTGTSHSFREVVDTALSLGPFEVEERPRSKDKVDHGFDDGLLRSLVPGFESTSLGEGMRLTFEAERRHAAKDGSR